MNKNIENAIIHGVEQCDICNRYIKGRIKYDNEQYSWVSYKTTSAKFGGTFCTSFCCEIFTKKKELELKKLKNSRLFNKVKV